MRRTCYHGVITESARLQLDVVAFRWPANYFCALLHLWVDTAFHGGRVAKPRLLLRYSLCSRYFARRRTGKALNSRIVCLRGPVSSRKRLVYPEDPFWGGCVRSRRQGSSSPIVFEILVHQFVSTVKHHHYADSQSAGLCTLSHLFWVLPS